jgi:hypothetical protein
MCERKLKRGRELGSKTNTIIRRVFTSANVSENQEGYACMKVCSNRRDVATTCVTQSVHRLSTANII